MRDGGSGQGEARESATLKRLQRDAVELWGAERAQAIDATLRRTAAALEKMEALRLDPSDPPGFFLNEFPGSIDQVTGEPQPGE